MQEASPIRGKMTHWAAWVMGNERLHSAAIVMLSKQIRKSPRSQAHSLSCQFVFPLRAMLNVNRA